MPDSQQASDTAWFDALPRDPAPQTAPEPQQPGKISVSVGSSPRANAPQTIERPTKGEADTSWFDKLPRDPPPEMAQQSQPSSPVSTTPDLPAWAGGGRQPTPAPAQTQPQTVGNVLGAIPSGLYEGVARIPNMPTDLLNTASGVMKGLTGQNYGSLPEPFNTNPTGYQPHGGAAQAIHDASSAISNTAALGFVARALTPLLPAGSAPAIVSQAVESPSKGVLTAAGIGGAADEPISRSVPEEYQPLARLGANLGLAGTAGATEAAIGGAARGGVTPEAARLASLGRDTYDIPISPAQMSNNKIIKTADSVLKTVPFSGYGDLDHETQLAVNRAAIRQTGENADKLTPDVVTTARTRIGNGLNDIEGRNNVDLSDPQTMQRLANIEANARSSLTDPEYGVITRQLNGLMANVQPGGEISGTTYGSLIHKGSPLDAAVNNSNSNIANYAGQIKDTLRDSLQNSLSGDDFGNYQQLRSQWKALKTLEPMMQRADVVGGASPSTGDINPIGLRSAVNKSYGDLSTAHPGQVPLHDIASIAQRFLKEPSTSNTSERTWLRNAIDKIGHGAILMGAGAGAAEGLPSLHTAALAGSGLLATGLIARGAGKVLQSDALAQRMMGSAPSAAQAATNVAVPLITSAGTRELEPPAPSVNPQTGLPQFSLEANQIDRKKQIADTIVSGFKDGSLASPDALKGFLSQNKRDIRQAMGGQGLTNIMFVQAMMRRPKTVFSILSNSPSPPVQEAMDSAGITDPHSLASLAIVSPELAKILATNTSRQNLTKAGESQVIAGIQKASQGEPDDRTVPSRMRSNLAGRNPMGQNREGNRAPMQTNVAAAGAPMGITS